MLSGVLLAQFLRQPFVVAVIVAVVGIAVLLVGYWMILDDEMRFLASTPRCSGQTACPAFEPSLEGQLGRGLLLGGFGAIVAGAPIAGAAAYNHWRVWRVIP